MDGYKNHALRDIAPLKRFGEAVLGASWRIERPDPSRLILWTPAALGAGAALYFSLSVEPAPLVLPVLCVLAACSALIALVVRGHTVGLYLCVLTAALSCGFALAQQRTHALAPPQLPALERAVTVTGWIEAVERSGSRPRLLIRVAELQGAPDPPKRIRLRAGLGEFRPGAAITVRAVLNPPPGPSAPGGYDPARAAWFESIALTGFAISALEPAHIGDRDAAARWLAGLRWQLAERIRAQTGPRTGGIAAALLTGDRSGVDPEDAEALRVSGLGHILAISGLHMALFAGGVYMVARLVLASIEPYARAHDPRKPAALIALLAASFYLALSGAAVSTQRAWVMAVVVLIGVMLDRRAFSMRSLAIAALFVIILAPESVVQAGFQMSFAAVAALIAVYESWRQIRPEPLAAPGLFTRLGQQMSGLTVTSLVAGAATGAFAAFHFQRMAAYGLLANLAAMPIFTFWVMPAGAVALVLTPFGLEGFALGVIDVGLKLVLAIAHWTSGLAGAGVSVIAAPGWVVGLYAMGFTLSTLGLGLVRLTGLVLGVAALVAWLVQAPPDIMISEDGVVIAEFDGASAYQASNTRRSRFDTRVFLQRAGQGQTPVVAAGLACDPRGCAGLTQDGILISITQFHEALAEDCAYADVVVFLGEASAWRKRRCEALLLDDEVRANLGGAEVFVRPGEALTFRAARDQARNRPWTPQGPT